MTYWYDDSDNNNNNNNNRIIIILTYQKYIYYDHWLQMQFDHLFLNTEFAKSKLT